MRVLVYGDFILDRYTSVETLRDCPERAGAPVYDVKSHTDFLGCAGNVWRNVQALMPIFDGMSLHVGGGIGPTLWDSILSGEHMMSSSEILRIAKNDITKQRIVLDGRIVCRIDSAKNFSFFSSESDDIDEIPTYDIVIVSDYCFGGVDEETCRALISSAKYSVVDTKRKDLSIFEGATAFKFNKHEYLQHCDKTIPSDWVVVSQGDNGCRVIEGKQEGRPVAQVAAWNDVEEVDVTGCGDTFTSALALYIASGRGVDMAAYAANYLASRVVTRLGPSVPTASEIQTGKIRGVL